MSANITQGWYHRSYKQGQNDDNVNKERDMLGFEEQNVNQRKASNDHKLYKLAGTHRKQTVYDV